MSGQVAVLGSFIVDWPLQLPRAPKVGETLVVESAGWYAGGKGINQAVGLKRMGVDPILIGQVGQDAFGDFLIAAVTEAGLAADYIFRHPKWRTGTAVPVLSPDGQYILHVAGANQHISAQDVARAADAAAPLSFAMLQGEVNPEANLALAYAVRKQGGRVVVDPAPATGVSFDLLRYADLITPNQVELEALSGQAVHGPDDAVRALTGLMARLPALSTGIATLGPAGAVVVTRREHYHLPAVAVKEVDATAAGDAFNACLVASLSQGTALYRAVQRAVAAGALACSRLGAVTSLPTREEVDALAGKP